MRCRALAFLSLSLSLALSAAQGAEPKPAIEVDAAGCTALTGAAYVPGVDATGASVAPADLPRESSAVGPDTLSIEIDPALAGQFGVPATGAGTYGTRPILGFVTVTDGRAYFNGKPLAPDAADALAAACRGARK